MARVAETFAPADTRFAERRMAAAKGAGMTTEQFLDYVRTHPATDDLGQAIEAVMTVRRRARRVPVPVRVADPRLLRLVAK